MLGSTHALNSMALGISLIWIYTHTVPRALSSAPRRSRPTKTAMMEKLPFCRFPAHGSCGEIVAMGIVAMVADRANTRGKRECVHQSGQRACIRVGVVCRSVANDPR